MIPEEAGVVTLVPQSPGWDHPYDYRIAQSLAEPWLNEGEDLGLIVPSVPAAPIESNVVVNARLPCSARSRWWTGSSRTSIIASGVSRSPQLPPHVREDYSSSSHRQVCLAMNERTLFQASADSAANSVCFRSKKEWGAPGYTTTSWSTPACSIA